MRQTLAIALITFREAIRSRALIIPFIFGLAVLASAPFTPAFSSPDRLRIMLSVATGAISLLIALIAIFISTTTMTSEIRDKRIFSVLSRSIGRFQFIIGKILGIWFTLATLLLALGLITYLIMQISASMILTPDEKSTILSANRPVIATEIDYYLRDVKIARYKAEQREYERILQLSNKLYAEGVIPEGVRFNALIAFLSEENEQIEIETPGIDPVRMKTFYANILSQLTGMDFGTNGAAWKQWYKDNPRFGQRAKNPDLTVELFSGDEKHVFSWQFAGLEEDDLEHGLRLQILAAVFPNPRAARFDGGRHKDPVYTADVEIAVEWGTHTKVLQATLSHLEHSTIILKDEFPSAGTDFTVRIKVLQGPSSIIVSTGSVEALLASGSFELNLIKSLILSWSLAALLAAVGIFGSCFVSFPVALLMCIFVLFWGSTSGFLKDLTKQPTGNPLFFQTAQVNSHRRTDLVSDISDKIYNGANFAGNFLAKGIADFSKYEGANYLPESKEIPNQLVVESLLKLLAWRAILLILLGWLLFKFREF